MIRIDAVWLALGASDLRGGIDRLLARVVQGFAPGAQAHHAYVFANRRADRLKVLVYDGVGMWLCTRRLQAGSFEGPREADSGALSRRPLFDRSPRSKSLQVRLAAATRPSSIASG